MYEVRYINSGSLVRETCGGVQELRSLLEKLNPDSIVGLYEVQQEEGKYPTSKKIDFTISDKLFVLYTK